MVPKGRWLNGYRASKLATCLKKWPQPRCKISTLNSIIWDTSMDIRDGDVEQSQPGRNLVWRSISVCSILIEKQGLSKQLMECT